MKTRPLRFPAKENPDMEKALLDWPIRDDLRFSNTTGILQKTKTMWFIGVEVEQETSAHRS